MHERTLLLSRDRGMILRRIAKCPVPHQRMLLNKYRHHKSFANAGEWKENVAAIAPFANADSLPQKSVRQNSASV